MTPDGKPLVILYSRSGHTRTVAERVAGLAEADVQRVATTRYRSSGFWIGRALLDVMTQAQPPVSRLDLKRAGRRPWIVAAGPVWAGRPAAPLRTVLARLRAVDVPVGVILTCRSTGSAAVAVATCEGVLGRRLAASCQVANSEEDTDSATRRLRSFLDVLCEARAGSAA